MLLPSCSLFQDGLFFVLCLKKSKVLTDTQGRMSLRDCQKSLSADAEFSILFKFLQEFQMLSAKLFQIFLRISDCGKVAAMMPYRHSNTSVVSGATRQTAARPAADLAARPHAV